MGWRTKFVFVLIVYAAGFATAIYCLAPTPDPQTGPPLPVSQVRSALKSQQLAKSFNSGMHKCIGFGKDAAAQAVAEAARLIQTKMDEAAQSQSKG